MGDLLVSGRVPSKKLTLSIIELYSWKNPAVFDGMSMKTRKDLGIFSRAIC